MIVFGVCVGDGGERYRDIALPSIERAALPGDILATETGERGICDAYNRLIERARSAPSCEALVLMHEDCEIVDRNFRAKALAACSRTGVGVLGVVGGSGLRDLAWWRGRTTAGAVFETRGFINEGPRQASVDAVDGLLMILSPAAFGSLEFDGVNFPAFHGYDVDFCLQARDAGLEVVVAPIDMLHRTAGGYGDKTAWDLAADALAKKWPSFVEPEPEVPEPEVPQPAQPKPRRRRILKGVRLRRNRPAAKVDPSPPVESSGEEPDAQPPAPEVMLSPPVEVSREEPDAQPPASRTVPELARGTLDCAVCHTVIPASTHEESVVIVECPNCGLGTIWPAPTRDADSDGIFVDMYGGNRLERREQWHREARLRVEWLELSLPEGCVLEVGCATGEFVRAALDAGYDAYGVEASVWGAEQARDLGVDVVTGYLEDWMQRYPGMRPDAVVFWHVLEHVADPGTFLEHVRELLGSGGHVVLEVPNFDSADARLLGLSWPGAQPADHYHLFQPTSLTMLLERCGYDVELMQPTSMRVYTPLERWHALKNEALVERRAWPPLDLLRAIATVRS